jgi:predicted transcriptional regulator
VSRHKREPELRITAMSPDIQRRILKLLYEQWFNNYTTGISVTQLMSQTSLDENEVSQFIEILQTNGLVERTRTGSYVMTSYGIDVYEENLSPSEISQRKQERRMILEALLQLYNQDTYRWMESEQLLSLIQNDNLIYLLGVAVYLENKGLVNLGILYGGISILG